MADMASIGRAIATQDNRITDQPIFIVQQKRTYPAHPDYDNNGIAWVGPDGEAGPDQHAQLEAAYGTYDREPDGWTRVAIRHHWEFVTACFTEQGCKDYLAANGHNLCEPRIYASSSHRNEEWRSVRKHLLDLAASQEPPHA